MFTLLHLGNTFIPTADDLASANHETEDLLSRVLSTPELVASSHDISSAMDADGLAGSGLGSASWLSGLNCDSHSLTSRESEMLLPRIAPEKINLLFNFQMSN